MQPAEFFVDEFTTPVVLPYGRTIRGIFSNPQKSVNIGFAGINSPEPTLCLLDADAVDLVEDDQLFIDGKAYKIRPPESAGEGVTLLRLYES